MSLDVEELADFEIEWWENYHTRDWDGLEEAVKKLREAQFGIEISDEAAGQFVRAAGAYIEYKKNLSNKDEKEAARYLALAGEHMKKHYEDIAQKLEDKFQAG